MENFQNVNEYSKFKLTLKICSTCHKPNEPIENLKAALKIDSNKLFKSFIVKLCICKIFESKTFRSIQTNKCQGKKLHSPSRRLQKQ